eukprot:scaffold125979_cov52-Attheya_sp.AAC.3
MKASHMEYRHSVLPLIGLASKRYRLEQSVVLILPPIFANTFFTKINLDSTNKSTDDASTLPALGVIRFQ